MGNNAFSSGSEEASHTAVCAYHHDTVDEGGWFSGTSTTVCTAKAPVSLPHHATITGLSCRVSDNTAEYYVSFVKLTRTNLGTNTTQNVFLTGASTGGLQTLAGTTEPGTNIAVVYNDQYVYRIHAQFNTNASWAFDSNGLSLRLYGCIISYQP